MKKKFSRGAWAFKKSNEVLGNSSHGRERRKRREKQLVVHYTGKFLGNEREKEFLLCFLSLEHEFLTMFFLKEFWAKGEAEKQTFSSRSTSSSNFFSSAFFLSRYRFDAFRFWASFLFKSTEEIESKEVLVRTFNYWETPTDSMIFPR